MEVVGMSDVIKVTKQGYEKLITRKEELFQKLKGVQGGKGYAAETGGNVWHDNFAFEELERQEMVLNKCIADISAQIKRAQIVPPLINDDFLQIGHVAKLELDDGVEKIFEIVGFGETELEATPPKIEYLAPIVNKFIGAEIGATAEIVINGRKQIITLADISRKED